MRKTSSPRVPGAPPDGQGHVPTKAELARWQQQRIALRADERRKAEAVISQGMDPATPATGGVIQPWSQGLPHSPLHRDERHAVGSPWLPPGNDER